MTPAKGYTEMKDSGIQWIGQIPTHWLLKKAKYCVSITNGSDPKSEGSVPVYGSGSESFKTCGEYKEGPAVLIGRKGATLHIPHYIEGRYWNVDTAFDVKPQEGFSLRYYYYLACVFDYNYYISQTTLPGMTQTNYNNMKLPCPSLDEQSAIAAYLDTQCAKIDEIIAQAKASIEDYKQWKASIIYEAVTKGLDPNAEMKDSGIEWIGEVPKNWAVCKTLYALSMPITDGPHTTPEFFDHGIPFISAEAVSCGNGRIDFSHKRGYISEEFYQECCKKYIPQIDDIFMIKSGATTGRVAMVDTDERFTIWSPLAVFRSNRDRIVPQYLFYFLQSDAYQKQVEFGWTYGTQQNIGMRTLETLKICLPPLCTQFEIVSYLENGCAIIDQVIAEKQSLIDDLESYKKSLIYEVVTGKRRV